MSTEAGGVLMVAVEGPQGWSISGELTITAPPDLAHTFSLAYGIAGEHCQALMTGITPPNVRMRELAELAGDLRRRYAMGGKDLRAKLEDFRATSGQIVTTPTTDLVSQSQGRRDLIRRLRHSIAVALVLLEDLEKGQTP